MKKTLNIITLLLLMFLPCNVFASNIKSEIVLSTRDLSKGDTVKVTVNLEQDLTKEEFNVFETIIEFDENTFYGIDEDSFETHNGWGDLIYNSETHALIIINRHGTTLDEDIVSFQMTVKNSANPSVQSIGLKDTFVSNPDEDIEVEYQNSNVNINMSLEDLSNSATTNKYMGAALVNVPVKLYYILTLIVLELIIAIVLVMLYYVASSKLSSKLQKRLLLLILCLIEAASLSAVFTYDLRKGDLNGDYTFNYEDARVLAEHIVNKNMLSNFKLESADMNSDGALTPQDLAIIVQKTTKKTTYIASLSDAVMEANAYEKGSVIDVRFLADVTNDETIKYVMIDGEKKEVERVSKNSNEYAVKLEVSQESKKYNYNVSEVILENGKSAKVDYDTEVMVLKDAPMLSAFTTKEDLANGQVNVALTIDDPDGAVVNAYYELYNSSNLVTKGTLVNGKNAFALNLENAVSYKLKIHIDYNRGGNSGEYYGVITDEYDLKIITDYRLTMSGLSLVQNGFETSYLEKSGEIFLTFNSSNVSGYNPKKLTIDGREYVVTNMGYGKYRVSIPNSILTGNPLYISKVTLSNGKVILVDENVSYTILKDRPKVAEITKREDIINNKMNVAFNLNDIEKTVSRVVVRLFDKDNVLISEEVITDGKYNVDLPTRDTSSYILRLYADYSRLDNSEAHSYKEEIIYEEQVGALIKAYVNDHNVDIKYPEKNSIIKLTYNIDSNYDVNVSNVIIDNIIYDVKKTGIDTYEVEIDVGENSGIREFNTKKIMFANGMSYDVDKSLSIDVLKEYPVIENYVVEEDLKKSSLSVSFDLYDKDSAFTSGKVILKDKTTQNIIDEEVMILGKNKVEFTLENAVKYDIDLVINGVLDTKTLESVSPNVLEDYVILSREYMLVTDYKLELVQIDTLNEGVITDYFEIGDKIDLQFTSTNLTEYYPIKAKIDGVTYDLVQNDVMYSLTIDGKEASGVTPLKFESITLSNHVEVSLDCSKKIEVLKAFPIVDDVEVQNSTDEVNVTLSILDIDSTLTGKKVRVTDDKMDIVYEDVLLEDSFNFTKTDSTVYTIEVLGTYDLDTNTFDDSSNAYVDAVIWSKTLDFSLEVLNMSDISTIHLYKNSLEGETVMLAVSLEELENLDEFVLKVVLTSGEIKTYNIESFNTENDILTFTLENEEWLSYEKDKYTTTFEIDYGSIVEGVATKN